jgi:hypothetical protein
MVLGPFLFDDGGVDKYPYYNHIRSSNFAKIQE